MQTEMPVHPLDDREVDALDGRIRGRVIRPSEAEYEAARHVWNGMVDRRPALIVRCAGAADVLEAIRFARSHGLPATARGGGHGVAGRCIAEDGVVVDLRPMNEVTVDQDRRLARVGPGATWRDFDRETQAFGLATTGGTDSRTGVAGLTLGGGLGLLGRRCGLTADNLVGAQVALADGTSVRADADQHQDLLWALRGGGGNFGIVTSFEFTLHEIGTEVLTAQVFHPIADAAMVLRAYRDFMRTAPDDLTLYALVVRVPPIDAFPAETHGAPSLALVGCYAGDADEGAAVLEPITSLGRPLLRVVQSMEYVALQQSFDAGSPDGERYYWKSHFVAEMPDDLIDLVVRHAAELQGPYTVLGFEALGGAIGRLHPGATAFAHRHAAYNFSVWTGWSDPARDDAMIDWTRRVHRSVEPFATGGTYLNYLDRDDDARAVDAFAGHLERLRSVKAHYDPAGLFSAHGAISARPRA